ncbi:hypothetical protein [Pseudobacillus badius]|uniref:hypothetical protein n=1 Tax=Bacillus badius TaxID=1455 RepID=UPI0024A5C55E|nr:hypothetical protein [Bacillus badius]GLY10354.1 hypothetical protein Bbad01_15700 [Bacillus badius]
MKTCFVVCPIGEDGSPERKRSDTVLKHIIQPVCTSLNFDVVRVDNIHDVDRIDATILEYLTSAELVIADLTDHNPNAFYELGYRHALGKPMIPIMEEGTRIPFDLSNVRTISYVTDDLDKAASAKDKIKETIIALNIQEATTNPEESLQRSNEINPVPYLLNIEDGIEEIKSLILSKNDELIEKIFSMSVNQIQKNAARPEDKALELFLTTLMSDPSKAESLIEMAEKFEKLK